MYDRNVSNDFDRILEALRSASPSDQRDVRDSMEKFTNSLNQWVDYRKNVIDALMEMCKQLNDYKNMSIITMGAGCSVGVVSSVLALVVPPVALGALFVGVSSSVIGGMSEYVKRKDQTYKAEKFQEYVRKDAELLNKLMEDNENLESVMQRVLKNEQFHHDLQNRNDLMSAQILICEAASCSFRSATAIFLHSSALTEVIMKSFICASVVCDIVLLFKCFFDFERKSHLAVEIEKFCEKLEKGIEEILKKTNELRNNEPEIETGSDYVLY